jgi:phosphoribosylformylglycinamidine cyclo-ligase
MNTSKITYRDSGVDIDKADDLKKGLKKTLQSEDSRVLNTVGAFSSLYDVQNLEGIEHPVLCLKMEEPGSKQLLAAQHGKLPQVGIDLIHHLINDTIMNGGRPLAILDTIVCGELENDVVAELVHEMAQAARREGCVLVGGETSEQPRVLSPQTYVLSAACIGVVERTQIIDGSSIVEGDVVYSVASNGVHTNGYTLLRSLLEKNPSLANLQVEESTFLEEALRPHRCYNSPLQRIFRSSNLHGLAHITGGGVVDNTQRILPAGVQAKIDLSTIKVPGIFSAIQDAGDVPHEDMLRTFNCGVGIVMIGSSTDCLKATETFADYGIESYPIGTIVSAKDAANEGKVICEGQLSF